MSEAKSGTALTPPRISLALSSETHHRKRRLPSRRSGEPVASEPSSALEAKVKHCAEHDDNANNDKVAVLRVPLGHVFEVHAIDPGDRSGYGQYRGPGGQLPRDHALTLLLPQIAHLEN